VPAGSGVQNRAEHNFVFKASTTLFSKQLSAIAGLQQFAVQVNVSAEKDGYYNLAAKSSTLKTVPPRETHNSKLSAG
jgi:hypothetical protein